MPGDGTVHSYAVLQLVIPNVPSIEYVRVDRRRTGTTDYGDAAIVHGTGSQSVRVSGLTPGALYDFRAVCVSGPNESAPAEINGFLAPGDTTAPALPGTPTVADKKLTVVTFTWAAPADLDLAKFEWQVRTAANGGGSLTASGTTPGPGPTFTRDFASIGYGVTRHFRVRSVDRTGNKLTTGGPSNDGWSASVSFSFARVITPDVTDEAITGRPPWYQNDGTLNIGQSSTALAFVDVESTSGGWVIVWAKTEVAAGAGGVLSIRIQRGDHLSGTIIDVVQVPAGATETVALLGRDFMSPGTQRYTLSGIGGDPINSAAFHRMVALNLMK